MNNRDKKRMSISGLFRRSEVNMPPKYRIRKVEDRWFVLRLYPVRHILYFPLADFETYEECLEEICKREGIIEP